MAISYKVVCDNCNKVDQDCKYISVIVTYTGFGKEQACKEFCSEECLKEYFTIKN